MIGHSGFVPCGRELAIDMLRSVDAEIGRLLDGLAALLGSDGPDEDGVQELEIVLDHFRSGSPHLRPLRRSP
jgi:hypothetical protein